MSDINPENGRWVCSTECPYDASNPEHRRQRWEHPKVVEVGDQEDGWPGGDIQRYRCECCGLEWKAELPQ